MYDNYTGDGPPKWVPFGQKLAKGKEGVKEKQNNGTENGTPAAAGKKEKSVDEEDNSEFDVQRNNAIEGTETSLAFEYLSNFNGLKRNYFHTFF